MTTHANCRPLRAHHPRRRGLTLVEVLLAVTIFGLVTAAITRQLIESIQLSLNTTRLVEYSRAGRGLIGHLSDDLRGSQSVTVYPEFNSRSSTVSAGGYGNYLVIHQVNSAGTIIRTVGYYAVANGSTGTFKLYRHDSADGAIAAGSLPGTTTQGSHHVLVSTFKVPSGTQLFRNWFNRGVSLRGQYGTAPGASDNALNYIQCTLTTRS